ncbi:hypothetical protein E4656_05350 [Natronospirillum operosum]|uniref:Uncharacterized protein n=1 Tax=Natronospirillum operosum TaxID=2759953 RepID=A0A4Z0WK21_9GAMM|nr:hypothetical protein [Natronospirillum operosum]TGG95831.1 hypothetical protein E4656_05350 [Natronospirillum operosum]
MPDIFDTFWFNLLQHFVVALAIPVLVGHFCASRSSWERLSIIVICFVVLWVLWTAMLTMQVHADLALLLSAIAVYTFIRSVARLRRTPVEKEGKEDKGENSEAS